MMTFLRLSGRALCCLTSGVLVMACAEKHCCAVPLVEANVPVTWTVAGAPAAKGCASAGAATVQAILAAGGGAIEPPPVTVPCVDGQAVLHGTLFAPTGMGPSAGSLKLRLLDATGGELSALLLHLVWDQGTVSATAPFAIAAPGGAVRYRWCQALSPGGTLTVTAEGPMWREVVVAAPAMELLVQGLAPGRYEISAVEGGGHTTGIRPAAVFIDVVDGAEQLVTVDPCPP